MAEGASADMITGPSTRLSHVDGRGTPASVPTLVRNGTRLIASTPQEMPAELRDELEYARAMGRRHARWD